MKTLFGFLICILFAGHIEADEMPSVQRISANNPIELRLVFSGSHWPQFERAMRKELQTFRDVRIVSEDADFDAVFLLMDTTNSVPSLYSASILVVAPLGNEGLTN